MWKYLLLNKKKYILESFQFQVFEQYIACLGKKKRGKKNRHF